MSKVTFKEVKQALDHIDTLILGCDNPACHCLENMSTIKDYFDQIKKTLTKFRVKNTKGYAGTGFIFDNTHPKKAEAAKIYKRPQDIKAALQVKEKAHNDIFRDVHSRDPEYDKKYNAARDTYKSLTKEELSFYIPEDLIVEIILDGEIIQELSAREFYLTY